MDKDIVAGDVPTDRILTILRVAKAKYLMDLLDGGLIRNDQYPCSKCSCIHWRASAIGARHTRFEVLV